MADDLPRTETCARCGRPPAEGRVFCHLYQSDGCVTLCSTDCALDFLQVGRGPGGPRPLEDIMDDLRWRNFGR